MLISQDGDVLFEVGFAAFDSYKIVLNSDTKLGLGFH